MKLRQARRASCLVTIAVALLVCALSAVNGTTSNVLFYDDFEGNPDFPNDQWLVGPFLPHTRGVVVVDPDNANNKALSFNSTTFFSGGGDLFTNGLFTSPTTGNFKVSFDFMGKPGCTAFVGWYFPPLPVTNDPQLLVGRQGWMGASTASVYCARDPLDTMVVRLQTCDQSMTGLPTTSTWAHYEIDPALACLVKFPRNETAIANGIGLTVEDVGDTPFSCFFDNVTISAVVPPSSAASLGTGSMQVNFTLDSPSLVMTPASQTSSVTADFVRAVEISSNNSVVVNRYFPAVNYSVASAGNEVTFTNSFPLYGTTNATFEVVYSLFSGEEQVDTGASNFTAAKDSLEWAIEIRNWPFASPLDTLLVEFSLGHFNGKGQGSFTLENKTFIEKEKLYVYVLRLTTGGQPGPALQLIVPVVAEVDSAQSDIPHPVLTTGSAFAQFVDEASSGSVLSNLSSIASAEGELVDSVVFLFPSFLSTINYDPNMGLLLTGTDKPDSSDNTLLIVLTTVLISCAILVVLSGLVVVYVLYRVRGVKPVNQEQFVQFDPTTERNGTL